MSEKMVEIRIKGAVDMEYLVSELISALREEIEKNDVALIPSGGAQSREIDKSPDSDD